MTDRDDSGAPPRKRTLARIRSGAFERGVSLARLGLTAGWRVTSHAAGGLFSSEDPGERRRDLLARQATALTKELGELKGSMMKVGQMLSTYGESILPPEANAVLKSLQSDSPTLAWDAIEAQLRAELGDPFHELDVDPTPLAAASLGQVHAATIRATGEQVAVKVQYPGVAKAIDADLSTLRTMLRVAGLVPTGPPAAALFSEVRDMLRREVDYTEERLTTDHFRAGVGDPRLLVPRTYPEFSTDRVLTTERMHGVRFDHPSVQELPQHRRDALGALLFDSLLHEVFVLRAVQTDPHFGNYLVQVDPEGDRVVLLDFGAVRPIDDAMMPVYRTFIEGAWRQDTRLLDEAGHAMGFLKHGDSEEFVHRFRELCLMVAEPLQGTYDWGASDLPGRLARTGKEGVLRFKLRTPPAWTFFLDRKLGGIYVLMTVLGARFDAGALIARHLEPLAP